MPLCKSRLWTADNLPSYLAPESWTITTRELPQSAGRFRFATVDARLSRANWLCVRAFCSAASPRLLHGSHKAAGRCGSCPNLPLTSCELWRYAPLTFALLKCL